MAQPAVLLERPLLHLVPPRPEQTREDLQGKSRAGVTRGRGGDIDLREMAEMGTGGIAVSDWARRDFRNLLGIKVLPLTECHSGQTTFSHSTHSTWLSRIRDPFLRSSRLTRFDPTLQPLRDFLLERRVARTIPTVGGRAQLLNHPQLHGIATERTITPLPLRGMLPQSQGVRIR